MTVTDNPMRNGVDTATLFATIDAVRATPEIAKFQFRATNRWVSGTHNQSTLHGFYGATQEMTHKQPFTYDADHPAVLVGAGQRPDAGGVPAPRHRRLPDLRHRQHRRRPRREPRLGRVDRRGRHRPARHPRAVRRGPQRLPADPRQLHAPRRRPREARVGRRAVPQAVRRVRRPDQRRPRRRSRSTPVDPASADAPGRRAGRAAADATNLRSPPSPMPTTHTLVIGAGPGRLGHEPVPHRRRHRSRRARTRPHRRALAQRTLGLAAAAHAQLGQPAPRMVLPGSAPGRLHDRRRPRRLPHLRTPVRSTRRSRKDTTSASFVGAENGFTVRTSDIVVVRPQRRDGHRLVRPTARARLRGASRSDGHPDHPEHLPRNPDLLPDGRVLVVGAAATGVQIADELARAGRDVVLAVGRHNRVPRRYRGMDIWWWLDRIGTFARPSTRSATRPGRATKARCSSSAATTTATSTFPRSSGSGSASPAGSPASTVTHLTFADDLRATTGRRRRASRAGCWCASTTTSTPPASTREVLPAVTPARLRADRTDLASPRPARWHHVGHVGHRATAARTRGCGSRSSTPTARSSSGAASPPSPVSTWSGSAFQHRRDSNFIDGVRHDASYVARHIAGRVGRHARRTFAQPRGRAMSTQHSAVTTSSSSVPAPPARPPRCSSPAPVSTCSSSTAADTGPTRCRPTP